MRNLVMLPFQEDWSRQYQHEASRLLRKKMTGVCSVHHIGSTAIAELCGVNTVDILLEVEQLKATAGTLQQLYALGYQLHATDGLTDGLFLQQIDSEGNLSFTVTLCEQGSSDAISRLAFRDYLSTHSDARLSYASLKQQLAEDFSRDWPSYCKGKQLAILSIGESAMEWWYNQ